MGDGYFDRIGTAPKSLFEHHLDKVKWAFKHGFRSAASMENYTNTFSTANWEILPAAEKSCTTQFEQLQKTFPLKPLFCPTLDEKENLSPREINAVVHQATGVPFAELAANMGYKSATEVNKIVSVTKTQCMRETREKLFSECSCQLHTNALQAAYESDVQEAQSYMHIILYTPTILPTSYLQHTYTNNEASSCRQSPSLLIYKCNAR